MSLLLGKQKTPVPNAWDGGSVVPPSLERGIPFSRCGYGIASSPRGRHNPIPYTQITAATPAKSTWLLPFGSRLPGPFGSSNSIGFHRTRLAALRRGPTRPVQSLSLFNWREYSHGDQPCQLFRRGNLRTASYDGPDGPSRLRNRTISGTEADRPGRWARPIALASRSDASLFTGRLPRARVM